jgi:hypothetical protein
LATATAVDAINAMALQRPMIRIFISLSSWRARSRLIVEAWLRAPAAVEAISNATV